MKRIYPFYHPLYEPPDKDLNAVASLREERIKKAKLRKKTT